MRPILKFSALALALSTLSAPSFAAGDWFEIELVIFERNGESSAETWRHDARAIDTSKAFDLEMARLMPNYPTCPVLDQAQIRQVLDDAQLTEDMMVLPVATGEQQLTQQQQPDVIKCIIPPPAREQIVEQVVDELVDQSQPTITEPESLSEYSALIDRPQQLAESPETGADASPVAGTEALVEAATDESALNTEQELQPQLTLPMNFVFRQVSYQVVEPAEILTKIPLQVSAEELATQLLAPHLLDKASLQLTDLVKKLRWQKNLTPRLHIGWRQHVAARHLARPLHLFAGQDFSDRYNHDGSLIPPRPPQELPLAQLQESFLTELNELRPDAEVISTDEPEQDVEDIPEEIAHIWEINGLFKVYLNRYLFIETQINRKMAETVTMMVPTDSEQVLNGQLRLNEAQDTDAATVTDTGVSLVKADIRDLADNSNAPRQNVETADQITPKTDVPWLVNHTLAQHRRVKSKQIHYFDHPDLGIIVQIRRFKLDTPQPPEQTR